MTDFPSETVEFHTRITKSALEVEHSRAYWEHRKDPEADSSARRAFDEHWFGSRSLLRIERLMQDLRARYDAFPSALHVLSRWSEMDPDTRRLICHWHLQFADPLYRAFTGKYLVQRREGNRPEVTRDLVIAWVGQQAPDRWKLPTQMKFASKLLTAANSAGLVASNRDPRPLRYPRVSDCGLDLSALSPARGSICRHVSWIIRFWPRSVCSAARLSNGCGALQPCDSGVRATWWISAGSTRT